MALPIETTRRDFLRGKPVRDAAGNLFEFASGEYFDKQTGPEFDSRSHQTSLITVTRRAMACQFQIAMPATNRVAVAAASSALDVIEQLEAQMTVYDPSSEVSGINRHAATAAVAVEAQLFSLFEMAMRLTNETEGAFDIAAGALIKAWGFFRGPKRVPDPAELMSVLDRVGSRHVTLDRVARTISFVQPGVELNLGAIGKGYAIDRAAELLMRDWNIECALLHGGQSSVLAIGWSSDQITEAGGWLVTIGDPQRPGEPIASVRLRNCALGTSGAALQFFEDAGRRFGHVLDPRTGWPSERHASVSVIAPTAALADALSTAFFILGPERAAGYCERHPDVGAVMVSNDRRTRGVDAVTLIGRATELVELIPVAAT